MQPNDIAYEGSTALERSLRELRRALTSLPDLGDQHSLAARIKYAEIRTRAASVALELHLFEQSVMSRK